MGGPAVPIPGTGPEFPTPNVYVGIVPYADLTFAEAYFAERMDSDSWDEQTDDAVKIKALKSATKWIDMIPVVGQKTDYLTQKQSFPRNGNEDIPPEISETCCEVALEILKGNTLEYLLEKLGLSSESIGDTSTSYEAGGAASLLDLNFGLPSAAAARLMAPWMEDTDVIRLERTS